MNITIGLSSLSAAFLSEAWTNASAEAVIALTAVAGTVLVIREAKRTLGMRPTLDTFTEYREARSVAQGRAAA